MTNIEPTTSSLKIVRNSTWTLFAFFILSKFIEIGFTFEIFFTSKEIMNGREMDCGQFPNSSFNNRDNALLVSQKDVTRTSTSLSLQWIIQGNGGGWYYCFINRKVFSGFIKKYLSSSLWTAVCKLEFSNFLFPFPHPQLLFFIFFFPFLFCLHPPRFRF